MQRDKSQSPGGRLFGFAKGAQWKGARDSQGKIMVKDNQEQPRSKPTLPNFNNSKQLLLQLLTQLIPVCGSMWGPEKYRNKTHEKRVTETERSAQRKTG